MTDIRKSTRPFLEGKTDDDFFQIDVSILQVFLLMSSYLYKLILLVQTHISYIFYGFVLLSYRLVIQGKRVRWVNIYSFIQVRVCSGKPTTIVASRNGFYPAGKPTLCTHSLVGLLQQISRIFDAVSYYFRNILWLQFFSGPHELKKILLDFVLQAYKALMKAFVEHNKVSFKLLYRRTTLFIFGESGKARGGL